MLFLKMVLTLWTYQTNIERLTKENLRTKQLLNWQCIYCIRFIDIFKKVTIIFQLKNKYFL